MPLSFQGTAIRLRKHRERWPELALASQCCQTSATLLMSALPRPLQLLLQWLLQLLLQST